MVGSSFRNFHGPPGPCSKPAPLAARVVLLKHLTVLLLVQAGNNRSGRAPTSAHVTAMKQTPRLRRCLLAVSPSVFGAPVVSVDETVCEQLLCSAFNSEELSRTFSMAGLGRAGRERALWDALCLGVADYYASAPTPMAATPTAVETAGSATPCCTLDGVTVCDGGAVDVPLDVDRDVYERGLAKLQAATTVEEVCIALGRLPMEVRETTRMVDALLCHWNTLLAVDADLFDVLSLAQLAACSLLGVRRPFEAVEVMLCARTQRAVEAGKALADEEVASWHARPQEVRGWDGMRDPTPARSMLDGALSARRMAVRQWTEDFSARVRSKREENGVTIVGSRP